MGFKKLSKEEIKYAIYDNIIGIPVMETKDKQENMEFFTGNQSASQNQRRQLAMDVEQRIGTLESAERGKKIMILDENLFTVEMNAKKATIKEIVEEKITLRNPASADSIWNINVKIGDKVFSVPELPPNEEWVDVSEKKVQGIKPNLAVFERFSRSERVDSPTGKNEYFLDKTGENEMNWAIFIQNTSQVKINALELYKDLPKSTKSIEHIECSMGQATTSSDKLRWIVENLEPGKMIKITFKLTLRPVIAGTGVIRVVYNFSQKADLSSEKILGLETDSSSKNKQIGVQGVIKTAGLIELTEMDEKPNHWNAGVKVINRSELAAKILTAEMEGKEGDKTITINKEDYASQGGIPLKALEEVVILKTIIESAKRPALKYKAEILPEFVFKENTTVVLSIEESGFELNSTAISKSLSKSELQSFTESELDVTLTVLNNSSIAISNLVFQEVLPEGFEIGNLDSISFEIDKHIYSIGDLKKQKKVTADDKDLGVINEKLHDLEEKITSLSNEIKNKAEEIKSVDTDRLKDVYQENKAKIESLVKEREELSNKKKGIEKNTESKRKEFDKASTAINQAITELETLNTAKKDLQDTDSLKAKKAAVEKEITSLKVKIDELKPQLEAEKDPKKIAKIEKQKDKLTAESDKNKEELKNLKARIQDIENKYKNQTTESISGKIDKLTQEKAQLETQFNEIKQEYDKINSELVEFDSMIKEKDNQISKLKDENEKISNSITNVDQNSKFINETQAKLDELNNERDLFLVKKQVVTLLDQPTTSTDDRIQRVVDELEKIISSSQTSGISIDILKQPTSQVLLVRVMDVNATLQEIKPNSTVKLTYSVKTLKPRPDNDYKFPSTMFYCLQTTNQFHRQSLAEKATPAINIIHQRRGISLGRIMDNYIESDKISITVIVKNTGNVGMKDLKIADFIPANSELFNMTHEAGEISKTAKQKKVIWKIDSLGPYQEVEISYILKFMDDARNMDDFDLIMVN